jgi:hypothetical protein
MNQNYIDTVRLLLAIAPAVFASGRFAMKGGTALNLFTTDLAVPVLATAELYGSKLVAAMDRQHPRDIFDVMHMLQRFGWQPEFIDCFVVYLAGHNRPVHEVLFPKVKPLEAAFTNEFAGMTREMIELDTLVQWQARLLQELPQQLTPSHRDFLLSMVRGDPVWELMPMPHLRELPAVQWKLMNLSQLKKNNVTSFAAQHQLLAQRLESLS